MEFPLAISLMLMENCVSARYATGEYSFYSMTSNYKDISKWDEYGRGIFAFRPRRHAGLRRVVGFSSSRLCAYKWEPNAVLIRRTIATRRIIAQNRPRLENVWRRSDVGKTARGVALISRPGSPLRRLPPRNLRSPSRCFLSHAPPLPPS